jgi:hypothetical protein
MLATSSLVTVMALLVGPVCAPLCAAYICSTSFGAAAASDHCHMAALEDQALRIHAVQNCATPELPPAVFFRAGKGSASDSDRIASPAGIPAAGAGIATTPLLHRRSKYAENESWRNSHRLHATSVLRI